METVFVKNPFVFQKNTLKLVISYVLKLDLFEVSGIFNSVDMLVPSMGCF